MSPEWIATGVAGVSMVFSVIALVRGPKETKTPPPAPEANVILEPNAEVIRAVPEPPKRKPNTAIWD